MDHFEGRGASWTITCLYDSTPSDGRTTNGNDVIHLLSLRFGFLGDTTAPGFTISYRQTGKPAVVRFSPSLIDFEDTDASTAIWRVPSTEFDPDVLESGVSIQRTPHFKYWGNEQKSLGQSWQALKSSVKSKLHQWCTSSSGEVGESQAVGPTSSPVIQDVSSTKSLKPLQHSTEGITSTAETTGSSTTINDHPAATTRSLATPGHSTLDTSGSSSASAIHIPDTLPRYWFIRILIPILVLFSLLGWLILRCKDPRLRADWAALKEERRNKRWFRRAARKQKLKNWFWNFRIKYRLATENVIRWDEKENRVAQQEKILEDVVRHDIRVLRNAHRVVSNVGTAEEGRHGYDHDLESSERRQSVSTLPGYESESSQSPLYDIENNHVVDGFQYRCRQQEFTPDSSIVSTSPRISRDGANSDVENEKVDVFNLGEGRPVEYPYRA